MSKKRKAKSSKRLLPKTIQLPSSDAGEQHIGVSSNKTGRPLFSFRHICNKEFCVKKCSIEQFKAYSDALRMLSDLEWGVIDGLPSNGRGYEAIPVKSLNASAKIPEPFSKAEAVLVFRFGGGGAVASRTAGRIAGIKDRDRFYVLFIDSRFDLYDHGS